MRLQISGLPYISRLNACLPCIANNEIGRVDEWVD